MAVLFPVFKEISTQFSIAAVLVCILTNSVRGFQEVFIRNWRPVCNVVGDAIFGAEFAPFPSPLPPASGGAGRVISLPALLRTCLDRLFCEQPAVCSGRLIFSLSLAIPQFKLVTQKLPPIVLRAQAGSLP